MRTLRLALLLAVIATLAVGVAVPYMVYKAYEEADA